VRSLPAAWPLLQYPLRAVSLAAVAQISEACVCVASKDRFPASRTITSIHRRAWRCATACWQADAGVHLHLGQGLLLQFSLTRQPLLHRFQIVHAHSLASRALLLFFVRCCCALRVQRHTKKDEQKAREGVAEKGASTAKAKDSNERAGTVAHLAPGRQEFFLGFLQLLYQCLAVCCCSLRHLHARTPATRHARAPARARKHQQTRVHAPPCTVMHRSRRTLRFIMHGFPAGGGALTMRKLSLSRVTFASCFCQDGETGAGGGALRVRPQVCSVGCRREAAVGSDGTPLCWRCRPWPGPCPLLEQE
jgi:hypothetical protein